MNTSYIVMGVIVFVAIVIYVLVKGAIDEKKGVDSEEKRVITNIIKSVVPESEKYNTIYATWETYNLSTGGRSVTTTTYYKYYGVAYNKETIWLVPLSFAGGDISYSEPMMFNKENLGAVNAAKGYGWAEFFDKEKNLITGVMACISNTKDDKYHPVNIQQKEEMEQFSVDLMDFMHTVNEYNNVEVSGKINKAFKK